MHQKDRQVELMAQELHQKDLQIKKLMVELMMQELHQKDLEIEQLSKRPRTVTNVTNNTQNNTQNNTLVDVRPFTKESLAHIPRAQIEKLLRDPPNAVAGLMRLAYKDPRNRNMRCPNKRENRYEVAKLVDGVMQWVPMLKDEALEEAHITFATALEAYADENDGGVGARFCKYADKVKDSQDGLDGGKLYAEQKALMHMTVTNRELM